MTTKVAAPKSKPEPRKYGSPDNPYGMGLDERKALMQKIAFAPDPASHITSGPPQSKYDSINALAKAEKIEALSNTKLDPTMIKDPYDKLAYVLHLWTETAKKAQAAPNISFTEQRKIAERFYDGLLAPTYANDLKLSPMSKELWMKQAYGEALNYNLKDSYGNDWLQSMRQGWNSGLASLARAGGRVTTMLGNAVDDAVSLWRNAAAERAKPDSERAATLGKGWHEQLKDLHNQIAAVPHEKSAVGDAILRGSVWQDEHRQFWADAIPAREGFINKATSFTAEQLAQAPIFAATDLAGGATLTAKLTSTATGRLVLGHLLAGAEGLAYGAATEKQDDPNEKYRDAIGFAVFHGLFEIAGFGVKKFIDLAPAGDNLNTLKNRQDAAMREKFGDMTKLDWLRMKARQDELMLRNFGEKTVDPVKKYEMHKAETANNIAVVGIGGQTAIHTDALAHVQEVEKLSKEDRNALEKKLLDEDPARWAPVLSAARFIRQTLGRTKLADVKPGSKLEQNLQTKLRKLVTDAASEMNTHVKGMAEESEKQAARNLSRPSAKHTLEFYVERVKRSLAKDPGSAALVSQETILKAAQKEYAADLQKAAEHAENEAGATKIEQVTNIAKRIKETAPMRTRSERKVGPNGNVSVRYGIEPDYSVRFAQHKRAAAKAGQSLKEYFADLSDEDFISDINNHFYPKALHDAGVFFEHQTTKEGMQNPNFLAFMHNYAPGMPKEFADELAERLIGTMKAQKYMNGRRATEPQLAYYAKSMYNHVDNLLGSGRWPKEANIFRTSNETIFQTTKWQRDLLIEKTVQEQANLKAAFSGKKNAKALASALKIHSELSRLRMNEFKNADIKRGSQDIIRSLDDQIADLITQNKKFERWKF